MHLLLLVKILGLQLAVSGWDRGPLNLTRLQKSENSDHIWNGSGYCLDLWWGAGGLFFRECSVLLKDGVG